MLIPCPHCGDRDLSEYSYLGDATMKRPISDNTQVEEWQKFVYNRLNPRGSHQEHWQHSGGCRLIVEVTRDTLTHEILLAKAAGPHNAGSGK